MRKFIGSQILLHAKASAHQEFLAALKPSDKKTSTMPSLNYADTDCLRLLNITTAHLPGTSLVVDDTVQFFHLYVVVYWMLIA